MDSLDQLRCFAAVYESGSFSKAAVLRGIQQGMASKAIASLERRLGVSLFHRTTRRVVPTEDGRTFYERCTPLIEELDEVTHQVSRGAGNLRGGLRIAAPATFGRLHLAPLLPLLLSRHPHLVLDVSLEDMRTDLISAGIDVALRVGGEDDPNEVVRRVGTTRVRLVGATRYFETHGIPRHPLDLAQHSCLMYARGASIPWRFSGPEGVFDVPTAGRLKSDNVDALRVAVAAGSGLAVLTEASLTEELLPPYARTVLDDYIPWKLDIKAVWVKRRFVPAKVRMFVEFLAEHLPNRRGVMKP
jgi:DNA-binding transcriptional LysR family regulator